MLFIERLLSGVARDPATGGAPWAAGKHPCPRTGVRGHAQDVRSLHLLRERYRLDLDAAVRLQALDQRGALLLVLALDHRIRLALADGGQAVARHALAHEVG